MKTKKNFAFDFLYNVIAYAIPVFANQIIIQPTLGKMLSEDVYGSILTLINLINLIPFTVGNTLNNLRLIRNQEYLDKRVNGDFGILLSIGCFPPATGVMPSTRPLRLFRSPMISPV